MKTKSHILLCLSVITVLMIPLLAIPAVNTVGGYFLQQEDKEYTWEVKISKGDSGFLIINQSDRIKLVLSTINITDVDGDLFEVVWCYIYNNSAANRTWELRFTNEVMIARCNNTHYITNDEFFAFIPSNETIITDWMQSLSWDNHSWVSGPHGYDGIGTMWDGNATGDLNEKKIVFQLAADGVVKYLEMYNGTGPGWDLVYKYELIRPTNGSDEIPAFSLLLIISAIGTIALFKRARTR